MNQCVCTLAGKCYIISDVIPTPPGNGVVARYTPLNDGSYYVSIEVGTTDTYDDQTGAQITLPNPFKVASVGCNGCAALRAAMSFTCVPTGPFTAFTLTPYFPPR